MRVLIWVQHLLGTGHLHRAFALGQALTARGLRVTIASGGAPGPATPGGIELVQLPWIRTADPGFSALVDQAGRPAGGALFARRRELLLQLLRDLAPRALTTEMFPFGRRAFTAELLPLLQAAGEAGIPRIASVRDVLVRKPDPAWTRWMRDLAIRHYEQVLVHTDPRVIPFALTFPWARDLGARLIETGYLAPPLPQVVAADTREVMISAGGGRVGQALIEAALQARPHTRHPAVRWRLITGAGVEDASFRSLSRDRPAGLILERHRADFHQLLAGSLLSVSQAGYNTVVEALAFGRPMVLVPFETETETEQTVRANRLRALGLAEVLHASELTPEALAQAIDRGLAGPPAPSGVVDLAGAARTAALVSQLAAR